jgi:hypothetical protein
MAASPTPTLYKEGEREVAEIKNSKPKVKSNKNKGLK